MALAVTPCYGDLAETISLQGDIMLMNISCSQIQVNQRAITRYMSARKKTEITHGNARRDGFFEEELYVRSGEASQHPEDLEEDMGVQIEGGRQQCKVELEGKVSCKRLQSEEKS